MYVRVRIFKKQATVRTPPVGAICQCVSERQDSLTFVMSHLLIIIQSLRTILAEVHRAKPSESL